MVRPRPEKSGSIGLLWLVLVLVALASIACMALAARREGSSHRVAHALAARIMRSTASSAVAETLPALEEAWNAGGTVEGKTFEPSVTRRVIEDHPPAEVSPVSVAHVERFGNAGSNGVVWLRVRVRVCALGRVCVRGTIEEGFPFAPSPYTPGGVYVVPIPCGRRRLSL